MDDFEAFRKAKQAKAEAKKKAANQGPTPTASGKPADWIDGFGPSGPTNPKVKGFMLGRYSKKKVDPATLQRPEGYEKTARATPAGQQQQSQAERELERRLAALKKAQADLEAAEIARAEAEVAARRKKEGFGSVKGRQRF